MSLNKFMHKRNPFKNKKIDFKHFSEKYSFFREVFKNIEDNKNVTVDFKSPSHIAAISKALLLEYMNLDVFLPLDRLIPTVPLRMNYILWIEDLLEGSQMNKEEINILDIGCGASCIYPLLGASTNNWFFKATEIDHVNASVATENVLKNKLENKIEIIHVSEDQPFLLEHAFSRGKSLSYISFVMCNPPFFANTLDKTSLLTTRNSHERDAPKSINTSIRNESLTDGGETNFTMKLIDESFGFQNKIGVFTIMLGKKSSSEAIKKYLISKSISNYSIYEFCQGRVMRWGIAWSFLPPFKHPISAFQMSRKQSRPPLLWSVPVNLVGLADYSVNAFYQSLKVIFNKLEFETLEQKNKQSQGGGFHLLITALKNTWSHQRRKRREILHLTKSSKKTDDVDVLSDEPDAKRRKIDIICEEGGALDCSSTSETHSSEFNADDCLLKCTFNVVVVMQNNFPTLQLQVGYVSGDKESMNQVLTFVKNTLSKPV